MIPFEDGYVEMNEWKGRGSYFLNYIVRLCRRHIPLIILGERHLPNAEYGPEHKLGYYKQGVN
jgi:hypothetical protein